MLFQSLFNIISNTCIRPCFCLIQKDVNVIDELPIGGSAILPTKWRDLAKLCTAKFGGERGIRTLGAAFGSTHDFQSCSFGQLGHLSVSMIIRDIRMIWFSSPKHKPVAERVGFEPTIPYSRNTAFRERGLQPLGNLSIAAISAGR